MTKKKEVSEQQNDEIRVDRREGVEEKYLLLDKLVTPDGCLLQVHMPVDKPQTPKERNHQAEKEDEARGMQVKPLPWYNEDSYVKRKNNRCKGAWSWMTYKRKRQKWRFQQQPGGNISEFLRTLERLLEKWKEYTGRVVKVDKVVLMGWTKQCVFLSF